MNDKILQAKLDMRRLIKSKDLTRMEQYNLLKEVASELTELEKFILIKECKRNIDSVDRSKDTERLFTLFMTQITMMLTLLGICNKDVIFPADTFSRVGFAIYVIFVIVILAVSLLQRYRSNSMEMYQHMLDILEE